MMHCIPPVGFRHGFVDILAALLASPCRSRARLSMSADETVAVYGFTSGSSAMLFSLRLLSQQMPERREVVIPAYTCYSVPAAVEQAGLKVRLCDIDPSTLDYDFAELEKLTNNSTLCIVAGHLFSAPVDTKRVSAVAKKHGAAVIEDAAQGGDKPDLAGEVDLKVYSTGRGKPLSTAGGGVLLVSNSRLCAAAERAFQHLEAPGIWAGIRPALSALISDVLIHPRLYWLPAMLPFLGLGKTVYPTLIPLGRMTAFQVRLQNRVANRMARVKAVRKQHARSYAAVLRDNSTVQQPQPVFSLDYAPARFPVYLAKDVAILSRECRASLRMLGIVPMYPAPLNTLPQLQGICRNCAQQFPGAASISRRLVTLPTHEWLSGGKRREIEAAIRGLVT